MIKRFEVCFSLFLLFFLSPKRLDLSFDLVSIGTLVVMFDFLRFNVPFFESFVLKWGSQDMWFGW